MYDCITSSTFLGHPSINEFPVSRFSSQLRSYKLVQHFSCAYCFYFTPSNELSLSRNQEEKYLIKASRSSRGVNPDGDYELFQELGLKDNKGKSGHQPRQPAKNIDEEGIVDFLEFGSNEKEESGLKGSGKGLRDKELVRVQESSDDELARNVAVRSVRQMMRRSNLIAKQVISIQSALSLGFVTQLWVDTNSWLVLVVEVRPNLLSGEPERFLLEDVAQVGDVVLVEDESVMENEFKLVGLETLVGYNVITPGRRTIGKVRGYTFNINSKAVESLELDSYGISIIPASLVSTYALFVEDVLEVGSDTVVVHEAAASRIQRLTKGLLGSRNMDDSIDEVDEYPGFERRQSQSDYRKRNSSARKSSPKRTDTADDWELPMDYL